MFKDLLGIYSNINNWLVYGGVLWGKEQNI